MADSKVARKQSHVSENTLYTCATSMLSTPVFNTLSKIKKTATGPDDLPFWVWEENAVVLIPEIKIIWDKTLSIQAWPNASKEANVIPLPIYQDGQ